jgi:hypothetical protein
MLQQPLVALGGRIRYVSPIRQNGVPGLISNTKLLQTSLNPS